VRAKVMPESPKRDEINADTGMTLAESKKFVLRYFEEFVNRKNLDIADVNFAPATR